MTSRKSKRMEREIVVITGAAMGIGRELAELCLKEGAQVVAIDRDLAALEGFKGHARKADVTDETALQAVAEEIRASVGNPTLWVNNAGIAVIGPFEKIPSAEFDQVMKVNFSGVVYGTRVALGVMREPVRGVIVNIASVSGKLPAPYMSAYTASKHAVIGFTRALQQELSISHSPVRAVLVTPGFARTKILEQGDFRLPQHLEFMVDSPGAVAREILDGILNGASVIAPTLNGKFLLAMHRLMPEWTLRASRLLVSKSWKEALGLSPIRR